MNYFKILKFKFISSVILIASLFTACQNYSEAELASFDKEITAYLKEKNILAESTETGLYISIQEEGNGEKIPFDAIIKVNYRGYLTNGRPFDVHMDKPVDLEIKRLVPGWREAMLYLSKGSKATLFIPPHLGYKTQEQKEIPANSILIFDIHIIDVN